MTHVIRYPPHKTSVRDSYQQNPNQSSPKFHRATKGTAKSHKIHETGASKRRGFVRTVLLWVAGQQKLQQCHDIAEGKKCCNSEDFILCQKVCRCVVNSSQNCR